MCMSFGMRDWKQIHVMICMSLLTRDWRQTHVHEPGRRDWRQTQVHEHWHERLETDSCAWALARQNGDRLMCMSLGRRALRQTHVNEPKLLDPEGQRNLLYSNYDSCYREDFAGLWAWF